MTNKELITILSDIESAVDVNSLTYEGYCVWPYIRAQISIRLMHGSRPQALPDNSSAKENGLNKIARKYRNLQSIMARNVENGPLIKRDLAFMVRTSERNALVKGAWLNPSGDTFCDLFEENYSIQLLEFSDNGIFPTTPQPRPSYYLDLRLSISQIKRKLKGLFTTEKISGFSGLMGYLEKIDISWPDAEKTISARLQLVFTWKEVFAEIISRMDPKLFFITCCYCEKSMAAILACSDLKIPVVEFQHGAQNDNNPFLTNWSKVPPHGYEMLPDFFWNWGEASRERIQKWAGKTTKHKAFVGGNLWLAKWLKDGFQTDDCDEYDIEQLFPANHKHLLISLQLWPDSFPEFLSNVLRNSPGDWFWHIRQHPRHKISEKELKRLLGNGNNISYEFHSASDMPLYLLLKNIDLHLTGYSTVAFEAAQFWVPTIFYHPNARDGFTELFDDNFFYYAEDSEQLLSLIDKILNRGKNKFNKNSYIEISNKKQIECLKTMIDVAQKRN